MKILLLGRFGKVGDAIKNELLRSGEYDIYSFSNFEPSKSNLWDKNTIDLDILDFEKVKLQIEKIKPDFIINSAAFTNVDGAEINKDLCLKLNAELPLILADVSMENNIHFIHISTDYIFDGANGPYNEKAMPNPINYYGFSKNEAEKGLLNLNYDKIAIVRTNFLYSINNFKTATFINQSILNLLEGKLINAVNSFWTTPVAVEDIAKGIKKIIEQKYQGIINFSGPDYLNRFEIIKLIADIFNFPANLINKLDIASFNFKAMRPIKAGLENHKAQTDLKLSFRSLKEGLNHIKKQL